MTVDALPTREQALALLHEWVENPGLRKHCLCVEAVMRAYARKYGEDEARWGLTGLIHDFDWERHPDAGRHPIHGVAVLREYGWPDDILRAVLGHANYTGVPRDTRMARALYACDELCGFLIACALVMPDRSIAAVESDYYKPDLGVLMEITGPGGAIIDHFDGRTLNPGHAIECAWFILHEAKLRRRDPRLLKLGLAILDCMWARGWDTEFGGLLYYTDLRGLPIQEYWAEMKFWWPHNEAEIATLLAWQLTGDGKYAEWHRMVHDWSHRVFPDREHGEWFGYAHRDGRISTRLKGNMWKGPFHLPRMQRYCLQLTEELLRGGA